MFRGLGSLYISGVVQVLLVVVNTVLISHQKPLGIFFVGGLISLVWSWNVKRVAFGNWKERITYSLGAGSGSLAGYYLGSILASLL